MTNFTKEELESLSSWGDVYTEFGMSWTYKMHKPLLDKLQFMIENYCEHEKCPNPDCKISKHPNNVTCLK